jgi:hypothetical protein
MELRWTTGKQARLVVVQGERVTLHSEAAFAPGAPITATIEAHPGQQLTVKVHGCRREGEQYVITGRLINLTRELKTLLATVTPA